MPEVSTVTIRSTRLTVLRRTTLEFSWPIGTALPLVVWTHTTAMALVVVVALAVQVALAVAVAKAEADEREANTNNIGALVAVLGTTGQM